MKLEKFIDILDKSNDRITNYFRRYGKDIFTNDRLLSALLEEKWSKKKWHKLIALKWIIRFNDEIYKKPIDIISIYDYFYNYMNCGCCFFGNKHVPFKEWEGLAKEEVDILKILVQENKLRNFEKDKRYQVFYEKYDKREEELVKKGYDQLWDGEYQ